MKDKNKILAIGIPSYNGEPYLDRCIPTFIHEDLLDKIEVIIVYYIGKLLIITSTFNCRYYSMMFHRKIV